jgi:hypothetical protein
MQHVFRRESARLLRHGICYPSNTSPTRAPKHQWLTIQLVRRRVDLLETQLCFSIDEALAAGATTVLLSTEGLYNHWTDYQSWAGPWLRDICAEVDLEIWLLLREPASFAAALFQQTLRSRRAGPGPIGPPQLAADALRRPALLVRLDYDAVVAWWESVLGPARVRVDVYLSSLAPLVGEVLGVPDLEWGAVRANPSLTGYGCRLLALLNALPLNDAERYAVIEHVTAIDVLAQAALGPQHILSDEEAEFVRAYARPSLERLVSRRPELSPLLR